MDTFSFPQFPAQVYVALYTNVANATAVRKRIIDAATAVGEEGERERDAVNFAFVDARLITSRLHLQTAIYQAVLAESQNTLRTRTVHSEVLWVLNPTNNITEAIRRYGVSDTTTALFVVRIGAVDDGVFHKIEAVVSGTLSPASMLESLTDWALVRKYYRLNHGADDIDVDEIVVSSVAMKSVMA